MSDNRKKNTSYIILLLLVLVVGISIGYAALSTTLNINGQSEINKATWDIHFANLIETPGSVTATSKAAILAGNPTEVSYDIVLNQPGDFYEFSVDVINAGTLPAKISVKPTLKGVSEAQDVYVNYTVTWKDTEETPKANDVIEPNNGKKTAVVRVEYDTNINPDQLPKVTETLTLSFSMNFVQA